MEIEESSQKPKSEKLPIRKIVYPLSEKNCSIWFADDFKSKEGDNGDQVRSFISFICRACQHQLMN